MTGHLACPPSRRGHRWRELTSEDYQRLIQIHRPVPIVVSPARRICDRCDEEWLKELARLERHLREMRAVTRGELVVYEIPRAGYTERKLRRVKPHTIKIIRERGWTPPPRRRRKRR